MQIEFIAQYFDKESSPKDRNFSPAGVAKMDYYLSVLSELGYPTNIYSTCSTNKIGIQSPKIKTNRAGQKIHYRASFGSKNPKIKFLDLILGRLALLFHLLLSRNCKNKIFFTYHERLYTPVIKLASKFRKLNIVMDVEELYSVAANHSRKKIEREIQSLAIDNTCYLFPTHRLREVINHSIDITKNPYAICSGSYSTDSILNNDERDANSVVYAGTFEAVKGSAIMAIRAAQFLPQSFTLYVCGFGTEKETLEVEQLIELHNKKGIGCNIVYRGTLLGDEYIKQLSKCRIGLAIQDPHKELNNTSFPSKILEYLRMGLKVVSSDIPVVREDKCSSLIMLFKPYNPETLAKAIIAENNQPTIDSKKALSSFHEEFKSKLKFMLNNFEYIEKCRH